MKDRVEEVVVGSQAVASYGGAEHEQEVSGKNYPEESLCHIVVADHPESFFPCRIENHEADSSDRHDHRQHCEHIIRMPIFDAVVACGESSGGYCGESLAYAVEEVHRSGPEQQYGYGGDSHIDPP